MKLGSMYMIQKPKNSGDGDSGSAHPKKFKTSRKVLAFLFWDKDGILLIDYLEKGATIM
jgi:hypothetical protein